MEGILFFALGSVLLSFAKKAPASGMEAREVFFCGR